MTEKPKEGPASFIYRTVKVPLPPLAEADFQTLVRLRQDAGHLWSSLALYHRMIRKDHRPWPSLISLAKEMTGLTAELGLSLGTQSQNLLFDEFLGVVQATAEARQQGSVSARYPWRERRARDVHWDRGKDARNVTGGFTLSLAMVKDEKNKSGLRRQKPLFVPYKPGIPKNCVTVTIHYAVLEKRFYLLFRIKERVKASQLAVVSSNVMGIDLGQIRLAACMTEDGHSLNVKGRGLRSLQQGLNRKKGWRRSRIDRKHPGSKNRRKEVAKLARESRRARAQIRNLLHTTSRRIVDFAMRAGVGRIFIGDATGVRDQDAGRRQNQANSDWPTGRLVKMITYKGKAVGIETVVIDERGTTRSCARPGCSGKSKPKGRVYRCPSCGLIAHRDGVGAWNICVRGYERTHGRTPDFKEESVALSGQTYLTPVGVKGVQTSPSPRNPFRIVRSAEQPRSGAGEHSKHVTRGISPADGVEQARPGRAVSEPARHQGLSGF